jgi:Holliday junction DNA helicase RuvA
MIARLTGTIGKGELGTAIVDVNGVGYRVQMPLSAWEQAQEGPKTTVYISTYVREDRFDLYGFLDDGLRMLFEHLISRPGIGPKLGLELCSVPRSLLARAVAEEDPTLLTSIKGIGRKSAEKLIVELKEVAEKMPSIIADVGGGGKMSAKFDRDAVAALSQLGYSSSDIVRALEAIPKELVTTEDRVTAALRSL